MDVRVEIAKQSAVDSRDVDVVRFDAEMEVIGAQRLIAEVAAVLAGAALFSRVNVVDGSMERNCLFDLSAFFGNGDLQADVAVGLLLKHSEATVGDDVGGRSDRLSDDRTDSKFKFLAPNEGNGLVNGRVVVVVVVHSFAAPL